MKNIPEITTYVATLQDVAAVVAAGCNHVIVDDPALSIRSWITPRPYDHLAALTTLLQEIKAAYPTLVVSVNADTLCQMSHHTLIADLERLVAIAPFTYLRVQDVGLLYHFHSRCACVFDAQMGNANALGMAGYARFATRQCVPLDLPVGSIRENQEKTKAILEVQVHGSILLQYSYRRFMAGASLNTGQSADMEQIERLAEDESYPGRRFTFLDNPHGHFMFAYFDRSLLNDYQTLLDCRLAAWVIDTRGQSHAYRQACIVAYRAIAEAPAANHEATIDRVKQIAPRPLKPGFFRVNQTDKRRFKKGATLLDTNDQCVATVIDLTKKRVTIACKQLVNIGAQVKVVHPKVTHLEMTISSLWDMDGEPLQQALPQQWVQIPYKKGLQQQALLIVSNTNNRVTEPS